MIRRQKYGLRQKMAGNVRQRKSVFFRTQQKRQVVLSDVPSACMLLLMEWKAKTMQTLHGLPVAAGIRIFLQFFRINIHIAEFRRRTLFDRTEDAKKGGKTGETRLKCCFRDRNIGIG